MAVTVADAKRASQIIVRDSTGKTQKVIIPADLKVSIPGNLSSLVLLGGLKVASKTVILNPSVATTYRVQEEDFLINVDSPFSSASIFLPDNPQNGQSYAIHDKSGLAGSFPITAFSSKTGILIDNSSSLAINTNFGSLFLVWEGSEWVNILTSSAVVGTTTTSDLTSLAANLDGLRWELPRIGPLQNAGLLAPCDNGSGIRTLMGGDPTVLYNVTIRLRGQVEVAPYIGGVAVSTNVYHGGTFQADSGVLSNQRNTYILQIGDPSDYWFLNRYSGTESSDQTYAIDVTMTVQIYGRSSVSLIAQERPSIENNNTGNCMEIANTTGVVVPGVDPYPAAYDGQFIQMDVISVTVA